MKTTTLALALGCQLLALLPRPPKGHPAQSALWASAFRTAIFALLCSVSFFQTGCVSKTSSDRADYTAALRAENDRLAAERDRLEDENHLLRIRFHLPE